MSKLKINENQFLGKAELNRLQKFLEDNGYKRDFLLNSDSFGLFEDFQIPEIGLILKENCLYVRKAGTPFNEIVVQKGVAVDSNANIIYNDVDRNLVVPNNSAWYWVKITHAFSSLEKGTVSIDAAGNITGVGTEFTKILRGQPDFPTKIRFQSSLNGNVYDYEVVKVVSDTSAVISGDFNIETNLKFSVVGTFTPGFPIPNDYKNIYQYDSIQIQLIQETILGNAPSYIAGTEFYLARVRNTGTDLTVQDKRIDWHRTTAATKIESVDRTTANPLIGVEAVKYDVETATKDSNILDLAFGFRFSSYTIDTNSKKVSILIGNGGTYKSTSQFQNGNFNGWRLYAKRGSYSRIIDSQKSGTQIVLTLDTLNPSDFGSADLLFIAPPYEEIEVKAEVPGLVDTRKNFLFPINTPLCKMKVNALDACVLYNLTYRYKNHLGYTDWKQFPNDTIGHYTETSFTITGALQPEPEDRTQRPYNGHLTNGFIQVCESPNSYDNFEALINTGDVFGVKSSQLSNATPLVDLRVSRDKRYQYFFRGTSPLVLSADIIIHLHRYKDEANTVLCRDGNNFIIHIDQWIDLSTFKLVIVQNYVSPTDYQIVANITANDIAYAKNNANPTNGSVRSGLFITCTFNDVGGWTCHYDTDVTQKGTVRMLKGVASNNFNVVTGEGVTIGFFGWKLMANMKDVFPMGTDIAAEAGTIEGSNSKTLSINEMPSHSHSVSVHGSNDGQPPGRIQGGDAEPIGTNTQDVQSTGGGQAFDIRPRRMKLVFLEKIV